MKDDRFYLIHVAECLERINSYVVDGREVFIQSTLIQDAVLRNLQVMVESVKRLSEQLRDTHQDVDWRGMIGLRNILVHDYLSVDRNTVWQIIEKDLPDFQTRVQSILDTLNDSA